MAKELQLSAVDILQDGLWHWAPGPYGRRLVPDEPNTIWVHGYWSKPGHKPMVDVPAFRAEYYPEADIQYLGMDVYATNGRLEALGKSVLAVVTPWPAPDFMSDIGSPDMDAAWFIRAWSPKEQDAGHFHMPFGEIIVEGDIRRIAEITASRQQSAQNN